MKRYIYTKEEPLIQPFIDRIDLVVITNDACTQGLKYLPVVASDNEFEDYDQYTVEEIMELLPSELRSITSPYALDKVAEAINDFNFSYKMTTRQKEILHRYYMDRANSEVELEEQDVSDVLDKIAKCKHVVGPQYRPDQPEKNFAEVHGLEMVPDDYIAILKNIKASECISAVKSAMTDKLGVILYEFVHDPHNYKLKYSDQVISEKLKIYIKIIPEYEKDYTIAIVSFHDALD